MVCNVKVTNVGKFGKKLNNEQIIRAFKKKCEKSGVLQDLKKHEYYVAPALKKKLKSKMARQRLEREELKKQSLLNSINKDK